MIKKLKTKFILTVMMAIIIVTGIIIGAVDSINYYRVREQVYDLLTLISEHGGEVDYANNSSSRYSGEALYELRYFTVTVDSQSKVTYVNINHIAAIDKDKAVYYALACYQMKSDRGLISRHHRQYGYLIKHIDQDSDMIIVVDCTTRMMMADYTVRISLYVGGASILLFTLAMMILSPMAIQPYIDNIENQKKFITNAGHELKTPLAVISANTEVIEMINGSSEWTKSTIQQVNRMNGLINELITLSRMSERAHVVLSDVDYSAILQECVDNFKPIIKKQGQTLNVAIQPSVHCQADSKNLQALIDVLLDNATKYCDDQGTISVTLMQKGKSTVLNVSNDYEEGAHLDYSHFFDRFYRQDESHNSQTRGFGIGLSMAASVVELFKGSIKVSYDRGIITFTVTI